MINKEKKQNKSGFLVKGIIMTSFFFLLSLLLPKTASAGAFPFSLSISSSEYCVDQGGAIDHNILYFTSFVPMSGEVVLERYFFDSLSGSWGPVDSWGNGYMYENEEIVYKNRTYSQAGDYKVAFGYVYRDSGGQIRTIQIESVAHIFERDVRNLGSITLNKGDIAKTVTVPGHSSNWYVGCYSAGSPGIWSAYNTNIPQTNWSYSLSPSNPCGSSTTYISYSSPPNEEIRPLSTVQHSVYGCSNDLPVQNGWTLTLNPAIFASGQGNGSWTNYDLSSTIVYSRANQVMYIGNYNIPPIPPLSTPTPTPSTSTCVGQYFGKWQCDIRADKSKPGSCRLNPAFGTINTANENDPINYWKWSYCLSGVITSVTPAPTTVISTPTPVSIPICLGQYFGKWQCDTRADKSKPGSCQLNLALGQINTANESDPINYWKWSYCLK